MEKKRSTRPKYGTVKLSVTVKRRLERKYGAKLQQINTAIQNWIDEDAKRGIQTVHVEVDNSEDKEMRKRHITPISGRVTPLKVKRVIDHLWKRLRPKYLVLFGGDDIVPMFRVPNPTLYWGQDVTDWDRMLPTDNPYATSKPFRLQEINSYLVPDRVIGRIPDMKRSSRQRRGDPAWLVEYLKTATQWAPNPPEFYKKTYAICTSESSSAGRECMEFISKPVSDLFISPPTRDTSASARNKLSRRLHLIKCHGTRLDPNFWGKGKRFVRAIKSTTLKECLKPATLVGATCCWGAQIFSPSARHARHGRWPLASTYLREGALAFVGSTGRAWFGGPTMGFADYIVADYLKWILRRASIGRAFLESKHGYMCYYLEGGGTADALDQKTMIEYVLLGDPSIHPVGKKVSRPDSKLDDQERAQRRVIHVRRANEIHKLLPRRTRFRPAAPAVAKAVFDSARKALGKHVMNEVAKFEIKPDAARVARLETRLGIENRQSLEYYWDGKRIGDEQTRTCLMRAETDLEGKLYRTYVGYSS
jgi:hypothetical protein